MSTASRSALLAVSLMLGLQTATSCDTGPAKAPPASPSTTPETPATSAEPPTISLAPLGRWRGDELCLELFANGDFEISLEGRGRGKQLVMGSAQSSTGQGSDIDLALSVTRIWNARYVGPCRKVHETGDWKASTQVLGTPFEAGQGAALTLRRKDHDEIELCGERCVTLTRDEPKLGARWRRSELEYPDSTKVPWSAGDLLELNIDETSSHLWAGTGVGEFATVYGNTTFTGLGDDRYELIFVADPDRSVSTTPVPLLGSALAPGGQRKFSVRRLPRQQLEVCESADLCVTLERQFDAYRYDLQ